MRTKPGRLSFSPALPCVDCCELTTQGLIYPVSYPGPLKGAGLWPLADQPQSRKRLRSWRMHRHLSVTEPAGSSAGRR